MHKLQVIQFTDHERRLLQEVIPILTICFERSDDDGLEAHKAINTLQEVGPIPRKRLEKAQGYLKTLEKQIEDECYISYWYDKAYEMDGIDGPEDLGNAGNPRSAAYMANVLAEARQGQLGTVRRALGLIDLGIVESSETVAREKFTEV